MASFQSFLHVGGQVYEILYYDLELGQAVDSLGRPASPVYGGILTIELPTPANDTTLYEWMVSPEKRMDGKVELKRLDSRATLKRIKFYNAFCVDMVLRFDGTANASSFKMTIRISPEQVEIGGLMHDNLWPDETPIGYVPDETAPKEDEPRLPPKPTLTAALVANQRPIAENPVVKDPPPKKARLYPVKLIPTPRIVRPPKPLSLLVRVAQWAVARLGWVAGTIGLTVLAIFIPTDAGVANEWERKLPEEDENRYRELEAKRSEALARGEKLSPAEEAEWQALEDRKFPVGRSGGGKKERIDKNQDQPIQLSKARFGHTFTTHGEDMTNFLTNRAHGSGQPQGQFLDNQLAAQFILDHLNQLGQGSVAVPIPDDFPARIINPDGTFSRPTHIMLVPGGKGVKTAYPVILP